MVDKYIKEILFEHGKVYVPGLGLIFKDLAEEINLDPFVLNQPKYTLHINQDYTDNEDTWLIYAAARGEHINIEDAENLVKQRVEEIKASLETNHQVTLQSIGTIIRESDKLEFDQSLNDDSPGLKDDTFGIPEQISVDQEEKEATVYSSEVSEPVVPVDHYSPPENTPATEPVQENNYYSEESYVEDDEESGSRKGLIAAIIIFLLITFGVTYYFLTKSDASVEQTVSTEDVNQPEVQEETSSATSETLPEENHLSSSGSSPSSVTNSESGANKPLAIKEKGKRYYIIVGAFTINENAQKLKRRLESKGIKVKIIEPGGQSSLHRVSISDFEELDQALASVEVFKKTYGNSLWILKY